MWGHNIIAQLNLYLTFKHTETHHEQLELLFTPSNHLVDRLIIWHLILLLNTADTQWQVEQRKAHSLNCVLVMQAHTFMCRHTS